MMEYKNMSVKTLIYGCIIFMFTISNNNVSNLDISPYMVNHQEIRNLCFNHNYKCLNMEDSSNLYRATASLCIAIQDSLNNIK